MRENGVGTGGDPRSPGSSSGGERPAVQTWRPADSAVEAAAPRATRCLTARSIPIIASITTPTTTPRAARTRKSGSRGRRTGDRGVRAPSAGHSETRNPPGTEGGRASFSRTELTKGTSLSTRLRMGGAGVGSSRTGSQRFWGQEEARSRELQGPLPEQLLVSAPPFQRARRPGPLWRRSGRLGRAGGRTLGTRSGRCAPPLA